MLLAFILRVMCRLVRVFPERVLTQGGLALCSTYRHRPHPGGPDPPWPKRSGERGVVGLRAFRLRAPAARDGVVAALEMVYSWRDASRIYSQGHVPVS